MKCLLLCLVALISVNLAAEPLSDAEPVKDDTPAKTEKAEPSPVERVVILLKSLQTNLNNDEQKEQKIYDKFACWCETVTGSKSIAILESKEKIEQLTHDIQAATARITLRQQEIAVLEEEMAENEATREKLTAARQKANEAFLARSDELMQALNALERAIKVLHKGTAPKLLQQDKSASVVGTAISLLPVKVKSTADKMSLLVEFSKTGTAYAPQSMTVQGILKDMYDQLAKDLEEENESESAGNFNFEKVMADLRKQYFDKSELKKKKEGELAEAEKIKAESIKEIDAEEEMKAHNIKFFDETVKACTAKHEEWVERSSQRKEELAGIKEAIKILSSDEARSLFADAIKPGVETGDTTFMQVSTVNAASMASQRAFQVLKAQAHKAKSLRLASLAASLRMTKAGHFDEVIKAIDDMIQTLKDEEQDDITKRDDCKDQLTDIESKRKDLLWKIENNKAAIARHEANIKTAEAEKQESLDHIEKIIEELEEMKEQRDKEHQAFLDAKKDDTDAIKLLKKAREALAKYYKKNKIEMGPIQGSVKGAALNQEPVFGVEEERAPDATFSKTSKRKNESKGVLSIMTMIIEDLGEEIIAATKAEAEALAAYEKARDDNLALKKSEEEFVEDMEEKIIDEGKKKTAEKEDQTQNEGDDDDQAKKHEEIWPDCSWILNSFESRRAARRAESDGLRQAKEYLVGYKPSASLLEQPVKFNDEAFGAVSFSHLN